MILYSWVPLLAFYCDSQTALHDIFAGSLHPVFVVRGDRLGFFPLASECDSGSNGSGRHVFTNSFCKTRGFTLAYASSRIEFSVAIEYATGFKGGFRCLCGDSCLLKKVSTQRLWSTMTSVGYQSRPYVEAATNAPTAEERGPTWPQVFTVNCKRGALSRLSAHEFVD